MDNPTTEETTVPTTGTPITEVPTAAPVESVAGETFPQVATATGTDSPLSVSPASSGEAGEPAVVAEAPITSSAPETAIAPAATYVAPAVTTEPGESLAGSSLAGSTSEEPVTPSGAPIVSEPSSPVVVETPVVVEPVTSVPTSTAEPLVGVANETLPAAAASPDDHLEGAASGPVVAAPTAPPVTLADLTTGALYVRTNAGEAAYVPVVAAAPHVHAERFALVKAKIESVLGKIKNGVQVTEHELISELEALHAKL